MEGMRGTQNIAVSDRIFFIFQSFTSRYRAASRIALVHHLHPSKAPPEAVSLVPLDVLEVEAWDTLVALLLGFLSLRGWFLFGSRRSLACRKLGFLWGEELLKRSSTIIR